MSEGGDRELDGLSVLRQCGEEACRHRWCLQSASLFKDMSGNTCLYVKPQTLAYARQFDCVRSVSENSKVKNFGYMIVNVTHN